MTLKPFRRAFLVATWLILAFSSPATQKTAAPAPLPVGSVIPSVVAAKNAGQTYALYLPSSYSSDRSWPVVYVFDPLARGKFALEQFQRAAEAQGFIVAASNNSRNGPWAPQLEAADAMLDDTQWRFAVDLKRIYFAGFSGGARVASRLAQLCKCAAGVILSGAGFPNGSPPSPDSRFAVFSAVGTSDFNYPEVILLQEALQKAVSPHWLRTFDGKHEWAPSEVLEEALAWFRVQFMKTQHEPRDGDFLTSQLDAATTRALRMENSGDLFSAFREYRQIEATFASAADVSRVHLRVGALEKDKAVRDATRRERADFDEQDRLTREIFAPLSSLTTNETTSSETTEKTLDLIRALRYRAQSEKRAERKLVLQRALSGVFIGFIESGNGDLDAKDFPAAARDLACAAEAHPESDFVYRQLALARVLGGDRKGAVKALAMARDKAADKAEFQEWLHSQPLLSALQ